MTADAERLAASNDHWSVTVSRHGEEIVTMETNCLSGREISPDDERTIRTAAEMLLAFIGDASPEGLRTLLDEREAEVARLRETIARLTKWQETDCVEFPGEPALAIAHAARWPDSRVDLARLFEEFAQSSREEVARLRGRVQYWVNMAGIAAQSSRETALGEAAELVEEASKAPKDWTWGRLKTAIRALITKGGADAV